MNRDLIKIKLVIAKICGWRRVTRGNWEGFWTCRGRKYFGDCPNFPEDLNACAEFERTADQWYSAALYHIVVPNSEQWADHTVTWPIATQLVKATALQRCEAFLRVKGLWKEE